MESTDQLVYSSQRLDWYQQARFGLFIHWGAYSVAGVEASWPIMTPDLAPLLFGNPTQISEAEYTALPDRFNPTGFDPDSWVALAQQAGMRYIVITAKHHDGFCMFDAPGTEYKITCTPYGKDICLELAQACERAGMPLGFYYSPPDMHHPAYRDTTRPARSNWLGEPKRPQWSDYLNYMESHLRKLLTGYGKVSVLWFDGLVNHAKYDPPRFHRLIHELSPDTLINDRLGDGYDFITPEQTIPAAGIPVRTGKPPSADSPGSETFFRTLLFLDTLPGTRGWLRKQVRKYAEGEVSLSSIPRLPFPTAEQFQPWETCMTMGKSWAYNPHETAWKAPEKLLRNLVEAVSRGGNYLLNVGPTGEGIFPPEVVERLLFIGRWMDAHHEAIYGASYTPLQGLPWGAATRIDDRLYLHVCEWPASQQIEIPSFPWRVSGIRLLNGEALPYTLQGGTLRIGLPPRAPDPTVSVIEVNLTRAVQ